MDGSPMNLDSPSYKLKVANANIAIAERKYDAIADPTYDARVRNVEITSPPREEHKVNGGFGPGEAGRYAYMLSQCSNRPRPASPWVLTRDGQTAAPSTPLIRKRVYDDFARDVNTTSPPTNSETAQQLDHAQITSLQGDAQITSTRVEPEITSSPRTSEVAVTIYERILNFSLGAFSFVATFLIYLANTTIKTGAPKVILAVDTTPNGNKRRAVESPSTLSASKRFVPKHRTLRARKPSLKKISPPLLPEKTPGSYPQLVTPPPSRGASQEEKHDSPMAAPAEMPDLKIPGTYDHTTLDAGTTSEIPASETTAAAEPADLGPSEENDTTTQVSGATSQLAGDEINAPTTGTHLENTKQNDTTAQSDWSMSLPPPPEVEDYDWMPKGGYSVLVKRDYSYLHAKPAASQPSEPKAEPPKRPMASDAAPLPSGPKPSARPRSTSYVHHWRRQTEWQKRSAEKDKQVDAMVAKSTRVLSGAFRSSSMYLQNNKVPSVNRAAPGTSISNKFQEIRARQRAASGEIVAKQRERVDREEAEKKAKEEVTRAAYEAAQQQLQDEIEQAEERLAQVSVSKTQPELQKQKKEHLIRTLDAESEARIIEAMETKNKQAVLATTADGTELTRHDFGSLLPQSGSGDRPSGWLNDEMVNGFLSTIVARRCEQVGYVKNAKSVPPMVAYPSMWYSNYKSKGIKGIESWSRRKQIKGEKLLQCEKVYFPVNTGSHWMLLVISPKEHTIEFLDSLHGRSGKAQFFRIAREWLQMEMGKEYKAGDWKELDSESAMQENSDDCGVFTCLNALAADGSREYAAIGERMGLGRRFLAAVLLGAERL